MSMPPRLPATFNRLAWSNLAAQSAEQVALAAAPIVAVLLLGVGEGQTGLLQTALTLPFVLFAIPAGLLADRLSRRTLMAAAEALREMSARGRQEFSTHVEPITADQYEVVIGPIFHAEYIARATMTDDQLIQLADYVVTTVGITV